MRSSILLCTLFLLSANLFAQTPPASDIFLVNLDSSGTPVNLTNRPGYDNQPFFVDDNILLYTSIREDNQADIYRFDLQTDSGTRLTATSESEYSPMTMPGSEFFSVVRVEADSTQRLWRFPFGGGEPSLILESIEKVGYYAWGDQQILAIFIVDNPPTLHIGDTRTGKSEMITENIGRSLHKDPYESAFSFVHKVSDSEWWIKRIDISSREITPLIQTLTGSEDYAWSPDSSLFMAQGSTLHRCNPKSDSQWLVIANFADAGIKQITRIAVTPNGKRLAFVSVE